ncbi:hypothetical protein BLNAU_13172 [Blattamonas nauphoetae]|uniref:Uncharacterized protein n=1 Tax=Blattamonas nauphoetae TaxID=2049346 RepID=A0ABQ9XKD7_9EUKA|nr:hypothetical protein BLNAU_13172 [Blattamonas nauphoetae]
MDFTSIAEFVEQSAHSPRNLSPKDRHNHFDSVPKQQTPAAESPERKESKPLSPPLPIVPISDPSLEKPYAHRTPPRHSHHRRRPHHKSRSKHRSRHRHRHSSSHSPSDSSSTSTASSSSEVHVKIHRATPALSSPPLLQSQTSPFRTAFQQTIQPHVLFTAASSPFSPFSVLSPSKRPDPQQSQSEIDLQAKADQYQETIKQLEAELDNVNQQKHEQETLTSQLRDERDRLQHQLKSLQQHFSENEQIRKETEKQQREHLEQVELQAQKQIDQQRRAIRKMKEQLITKSQQSLIDMEKAIENKQQDMQFLQNAVKQSSDVLGEIDRRARSIVSRVCEGRRKLKDTNTTNDPERLERSISLVDGIETRFESDWTERKAKMKNGRGSDALEALNGLNIATFAQIEKAADALQLIQEQRSSEREEERNALLLKREAETEKVIAENQRLEREKQQLERELELMEQEMDEIKDLLQSWVDKEKQWKARAELDQERIQSLTDSSTQLSRDLQQNKHDFEQIAEEAEKRRLEAEWKNDELQSKLLEQEENFRLLENETKEKLDAMKEKMRNLSQVEQSRLDLEYELGIRAREKERVEKERDDALREKEETVQRQQTLELQLQAVQKQLAETQAEIKMKDVLLAGQAEEASKLRQAEKSTQQKWEEREHEITEREGRVNLMMERIRDLTEALSTKEDIIADLQTTVDELNQERIDTDAHIDELEEDLKTKDETIELVQKEVSKLQSDYQNVVKQKGQAEAATKREEERVKEKDAQLDVLHGKVQEIEESIQQLRWALNEKDEMLKEEKSKYLFLEDEMKEILRENETVKKENKTIQDKMRMLNQALSTF